MSFVPQLYIEFSQRNHVRYNLVYDPEASRNRANMGCDHNTSADNKFYYNICWGATNSSGITNRWSADGTIFYGNVIYDCYYGFNIKDITGTIIKNNIVMGSDNFSMEFDTAAKTEITSDYNCWADSGNIFREEGVGTLSLATWQSATGQDANSLDNEDPLFTDAAGDDFTLQAASPCIGAGADLGASYSGAIMPGSTWTDGVTTGDQDDY